MRDLIKQKLKRLLNQEEGTSSKEWGGRKRMVLVYPNTYSVGMSNLAVHTIYKIVNKRPDWLCERAFLPSERLRQKMFELKIPLMSIESQTPISRFDLVAFTIPFEIDYLGILQILELGNIPLLYSQRDQTHPLIIAGGITTYLNPEPLYLFVDIFVIGEAEVTLEPLLNLISSEKSKKIILKEASLLPGIYIPSLYKINPQGKISPLKHSKAPEKIRRHDSKYLQIPSTTTIKTPKAEFKQYLIELSKGCKENCRFCALKYVKKPYREYPTIKIIQAIQNCPENKIGLLAAMISQYKGLKHLKDIIKNKEISLSSISIKDLKQNQPLLDIIQEGKVKSITLAPETGTQRLRKIINKRFENEELIQAIKTILETKGRNIKLYFMIGLPQETQEDLQAIVSLCTNSLKIIQKKRARLAITVTPFVPKPSTPFQWSQIPHDLEKRMGFLKKELKRAGCLDIRMESPWLTKWQCLLSRGDRQISHLLYKIYQKGERPKTLLKRNKELERYIHRMYNLEEELAWDFIDLGYKKTLLKEEYKKALE